MADAIKPEWTSAIANWAMTKPSITEVYIFGSRVKWTHRANSDLDVAVSINSASETPLTTWIYEGRKWEEELGELLTVDVDLEMMDEADNVVLPAVREHGIRIYAQN